LPVCSIALITLLCQIVGNLQTAHAARSWARTHVAINKKQSWARLIPKRKDMTKMKREGKTRLRNNDREHDRVRKREGNVKGELTSGENFLYNKRDFKVLYTQQCVHIKQLVYTEQHYFQKPQKKRPWEIATLKTLSPSQGHPSEINKKGIEKESLSQTKCVSTKRNGALICFARNQQPVSKQTTCSYF
jgi:hypothetical protein